MNFPWLSRKPKSRPRPRVPLPWGSFTLDEWRANEARVAYARDLMQQANFQAMLSVLASTCPVPDISDVPRAGLEAARVRGYQQAIHVLIAMATPIEPDKPEVEADYSTPVEDLISTESE